MFEATYDRRFTGNAGNRGQTQPVTRRHRGSVLGHTPTYADEQVTVESLREMAHPDLSLAQIHPEYGQPRELMLGLDTAAEIVALGREFATELAHGSNKLTLPDWPSNVCLAAVSWALSLQSLAGYAKTLHLHSRQPEDLADALSNWQAAAQEAGHTKPLRMKGGGFGWITSQNDPRSRVDRLAGAAATLRLARGWPIIQSSLVSRIDCIGAQPLSHITIDYDARRALDAALCQDLSRTRVAVVNAASAYQMGGGFGTGGRHALEESMCMQSTLYLSLLQASEEQPQLYQKSRSSNQVPLLAGGCALLSPDVIIFRDGTAEGYERRIQPETLAGVISVAMPNRNVFVQDSPVFSGDYEGVVKQKLACVLQAANAARAEVLIMPDVGCGVFQNNPAEVGRMFGEKVAHCATRTLKRIICVGQPAFFTAAQTAAQGCRHRQGEIRCEPRIVPVVARSCVSPTADAPPLYRAGTGSVRAQSVTSTYVRQTFGDRSCLPLFSNRPGYVPNTVCSF